MKRLPVAIIMGAVFVLSCGGEKLTHRPKNECLTNNGGCDLNATCTDTADAFLCECNAGYRGDGFSCVDIDECVETPEACATHAICTNLPGAYLCECEQGFRGDGKQSCDDIDECAEGTDDCHADADCINQPGSYDCRCREEFEGDGRLCLPVTVCDEETICGPNAECIRENGADRCVCKNGYVGDGEVCEVRFISISAGYATTCALRSDKTIWCWGDNLYGQFGDGTMNYSFVPALAAGGMKGWQAVANAGGITFALQEDGTLWSWGFNRYGNLGNGTTTDSLVPVRVATDLKFKSLAKGSASCAIAGDDSLWCWGQNNSGTVGDGTTTSRLTPYHVAPGTTWLEVSGSGNQNCGLRSDGSIWCWGMNYDGGLGDGTTTPRATPGPILSARQFTSVMSGSGLGCGVTSSGELWCWGATFVADPRGGGGNNYQLGDFANPYPTRIGTSADWQTVYAGVFQACAQKRSGSLWCWGQNGWGEVGNGTISRNVTAPTKISLETDWISVSGGAFSTCGVRRAGSVWCWGTNQYGQMGIGPLSATSADNRKLVPTPVLMP